MKPLMYCVRDGAGEPTVAVTIPPAQS
jgi:hypothetical protein